MSAPAATFGDVFVRACAAKPGTQSAAMPGEHRAPDARLAIFGAGDTAFVFTARGVSFKDTAGAPRAYSWEELDFILPGDLSLASDKLHAFSDFKGVAERIARTFGRACAIGATGLLAAALIFYVGSVILALDHAAREAVGWFGDILTVIAVIVACMFAASLAIPLGIALLGAGGLVGWAANALGRQVRPIVHWFLKRKYGNFSNGLSIMGSQWITHPGGTPTTELVDLVMLGVKLRRRGIA